MGRIKSILALKKGGRRLTIICTILDRKECIMPRRNSLKHDLFVQLQNITNNRTRTSYKRAITRFTSGLKNTTLGKKSDITEEAIQLYPTRSK